MGIDESMVVIGRILRLALRTTTNTTTITNKTNKTNKVARRPHIFISDDNI